MAATATSEVAWKAQDTSPRAIEAALRQLLAQLHARNEGWTPARVLNLVCVVDARGGGQVMRRLRGVGRYHPSRTVVCKVHPRRDRIDAAARIVTPAGRAPGDLALAREMVVVDVGPQHVAHLDTIVDPLVMTDLATLAWAPHRHADGVEALLELAQAVLIDSAGTRAPADALSRAAELTGRVYVVDLAWLRSTPWRERIAAAFDPPSARADLAEISAVTIRHHPNSTAAALLLMGWLASRLQWNVTPLRPRHGGLRGRARGQGHDVAIRFERDPTQPVPGLQGVEIRSASGHSLRFDRGVGGLRAHQHDAPATSDAGQADSRVWTILGASRGEAGILGEGFRQALLRDATYRPALELASAMAAFARAS